MFACTQNSTRAICAGVVVIRPPKASSLELTPAAFFKRLSCTACMRHAQTAEAASKVAILTGLAPDLYVHVHYFLLPKILFSWERWALGGLTFRLPSDNFSPQPPPPHADMPLERGLGAPCRSSWPPGRMLISSFIALPLACM